MRASASSSAPATCCCSTNPRPSSTTSTPSSTRDAASALWHKRRVLLALCDMRTLYLRNVPDEVSERLAVLAAREGMSVSAFALRELAEVARRADNPALLGDLPDLDVSAADVVADL